MLHRALIKKYTQDNSGSNAIEAAFCFPIVILIIFACYEYSIFFQNSAEVNHIFDDVSRQVVLLENPSKSDVEQLMKTSYGTDESSGVSYDVKITEKYDQQFADITVNYAHTVFLPFAKEYAMKTQYQNLVMLTTSFE